MVAAEKRPVYLFLAVLTIASVVGLQAWMILFNNFAVEVVGLDGDQVGVVQAVREIPGFLALLAVYVMLFLREDRLSALSIVLLGIGTGLAGFFPSYSGLLATTLIMSFGFHYFETTNQSLTLQHFCSATSPLVFGRLRSLAAISSIAVALLILLLSSLLDFRFLFLLFGLLVAGAGVWGLLRSPAAPVAVPQRRQMILRRRYSLYYFLTFMAGARRQIFIAFSAFLMVKIFGFSVRDITLLFLLTNLVGFIANPLIGKAIVRFGERRVLGVEYTGLIFVFLAYAFTQSKWVIVAMYVLDHLLFQFAIAIRTYFQKIGDPGDIAPSMAVGFTINHIAAVVLPVVGGALWMVDYRIPFILGAVLSFVSLLATRRIPRFGTAEGSPAAVRTG